MATVVVFGYHTSSPTFYPDEKNWSVLMRRLKTPLSEYKPKRFVVPLITLFSYPAVSQSF